MTNENSKPIGKNDDSAKEFIIRSLAGDKTYGFDLDSVYKTYDKNNKCYIYYIFEYLKCEHASKTPHTSNPKYYPYNWRKFYSLFEIAKKLNGKLILVNYSDGYKTTKGADGKITAVPLTDDEEKLRKISNQVKIFTVKNFDLDKVLRWEQMPKYQRPKYLEYLTFEKEECISFDQFSEKLRKLNKMASEVPMQLMQEIINNEDD